MPPFHPGAEEDAFVPEKLRKLRLDIVEEVSSVRLSVEFDQSF